MRPNRKQQSTAASKLPAITARFTASSSTAFGPTACEGVCVRRRDAETQSARGARAEHSRARVKLERWSRFRDRERQREPA
eukprot:3458861-Rhodomonas_salina.5